jgi:hypothetical protein
MKEETESALRGRRSLRDMCWASRVLPLVADGSLCGPPGRKDLMIVLMIPGGLHA